MAECIGTIAAGVQLVDFAAKVSHGIIQLCIKAHNAPKELIELKRQLDRISELLLQVTDTETALNRSGVIPVMQLATIRSVLEDAKDLVHGLEQICVQNEAIVPMKKHLKIKLALYGLDNITAVATRLRIVIQDLSQALQTSSLCLGVAILEKTKTIEDSVVAGIQKSELILQQVRESGTSLSAGLLSNQTILTQIKNVSDLLSTAHTRSEQHESEVISILQRLVGLQMNGRRSQVANRAETLLDGEEQPTSSYPRLVERVTGWRLEAPWLGIRYSLVQVESFRRTDVSRSLMSKLPFLTYAVLLRVSYWSPPLCRHITLLPGSGVSLSKVVPEDSDIMVACRQGNAAAVKSCFSQNRARTDDISAKNMTLLLEAAQGGSSDVVRFLIGQHRASVNWTGGSRQTSPLQWAIQHGNNDVVRILIDNDADLAHVSTLGWSPLFYCWPHPRRNESSRIDIINMLADKVSLEPNMLDCGGWTVFQRAASFGTAEDVEALLALGANPYTPAPPLQWNAMHHAAHASNCSTLVALLSHCGQHCLQMQDIRGWSLLHIAAANGSRDIMNILLERGVDASILSFPRRSHMATPLFGREVTAEEVAEAYGHHAAYVVCLLKARRSDIPPEEIDEDRFWDAAEEVSR